MRRFMKQLKNGMLEVSYCMACQKKIWPPYEHCPACYRRTSMATAGGFGKIVEFSKSWLEDEVVALIDMDGILLLGSVLEDRRIAIGAQVELIATGITPERKIYFCFRTLDRFDSYTMNK